MQTDIIPIVQLVQQWAPSGLLVWVTWRLAAVEEKLNDVKLKLGEHLIKGEECIKSKFQTWAAEKKDEKESAPIPIG